MSDCTYMLLTSQKSLTPAVSSYNQNTYLKPSCPELLRSTGPFKSCLSPPTGSYGPKPSTLSIPKPIAQSSASHLDPGTPDMPFNTGYGSGGLTQSPTHYTTRLTNDGRYSTRAAADARTLTITRSRIRHDTSPLPPIRRLHLR